MPNFKLLGRVSKIDHSENRQFLYTMAPRTVKSVLTKLYISIHLFTVHLSFPFKGNTTNLVHVQIGNLVLIALKSDPTHHFACTKSGSLRFSQFSGC
jgi:hypothetical protein